MLLLLFSTSDDLIYDEEVRRKFADIVRLLYSVYRVTKVQKYFTDADVCEINRKALSINQKMAELFELDVDQSTDTRTFAEASAVSAHEPRKMKPAKKDGSGEDAKAQKAPPTKTKWGHVTLPGEGTRTAKWHCLLQIGQTIAKAGSLKITSTSYYEEFHRLIRDQFHFTNKHDEAQMSSSVLRASYLARVKVAGAVRRNVNVRARAFVESRQAAWGADDDGDAPSDDESVDSEESGLFFCNYVQSWVLLTSPLPCRSRRRSSLALHAHRVYLEDEISACQNLGVS